MRAQIAERKAEILTVLRQRSSSNRIAAPPIKHRANNEPAPLSFAQERLWFLDQLEPESTVYNVCRASRLSGNLSSSALEASLNEIVSRHETLRTALRLIDGKPVQIVQPAGRIPIDFTDLRSVPESERDAEIQLRIKAEAVRAFDLQSAFLLRCMLLRVADQEHILVLMTHHSATDAWSMGILARELWTLYDAFSNSKPSPLEPLPVQYSDYAAWQRNWLQGEVLDTQLSYWQERLKDLLVLNLPTDRPRKPRQSFHGARLPIVLPEDLTRSVSELSDRFAVTPFMTLLAAFQVLLYRYTGQEDVVVGSPIANRRRQEIEGLIGFFVNTLVLRADLSGNPGFKELLARVREVCLGAYAHQDLPFEKLVHKLHPERDQSRNPLFQVMFVLQNATRPFTGIPGFRIEPLEVATSRSPFDLSLFLREREGKYIGYIEYSTDLFDRDRIERMAGHYRTLLEGIVSDPDQSIATLPILTKSERHQILVEWNDTAADYPKDKCIHHLFEEQVERTPEAIAVEFEDQQITYRELNQRANQLAHYLITLGIGPEKLVGICVERSIEMVLGLLGILKAGGAYVPLDPNYPRQRLRFMVEDSQVCVLLYQRHLLANLPQTSAVGVCLEELIVLNGVTPANPKNEVTPDTAAYVIYTSGSTGTPKGSIGLHRGAVNRFAWMWSTYPFGANEMSCIKTSLNFVDSVWEVFGPLLKGVPSVMIPEPVAKDPQLLIKTLAENHVTRIVLVPSLLKAILDSNPNLQRHLPDLKLWTSSGEPLSKELAQRFHECLSNSSLLNLYGSSEVSADATCYDTRKTESSGSISIGRPMQNTQIYLLDSHLQPVPIGIYGEIWVGGLGLARGYLNQPQLTAEKFMPNIFSCEPGSRLYRTGDRARYLSDASIEFLGRFDNQVKIRGYRIELREIEVVLNQHPAVRESIIVAHKATSTAETRLIAYVVSTDQRTASANQLRSCLKDELPDFMVPSVFVFLEALPLMPNGKVDRRALPLPENARPQRQNGFVSPRSEIEQVVVQVWREVLNIEKIGIHDNFFELGGHSLTAMLVVAGLRDAFRTEVPLRFLFEAPTVADLIHKIETFNKREVDLQFPAILRGSHEGALPLSISQEHLWHFDRMIPGSHLLNIPYAFHLMGTLDIGALTNSLREIMRRHEVLRTVFPEVDGQPVRRTAPEDEIVAIDGRRSSSARHPSSYGW